MSERNFTNQRYPNLPDAPPLVEVTSFSDASPYHVGCDSAQQQSFVMAGLKNMACLFIAEQSKLAVGKLDFSIKSLPVVDAILKEFCANNSQPTREELEVFVSQAGAYVGTCLEYHYHGRQVDARWHPSFPKYYFSSFRFPLLNDPNKILVETNPFSVVTRRLVQTLHNEEKTRHPSLVEYAKMVVT